MYPPRPASSSISRTTSGAAMLAQPRRQRQSEVIPPMNISSKLLGLSEGSHSKKEHSYDDDNGNEVVLRSNQRHKKSSSFAADGSIDSGDVSPGGTLHKSRSSAAKLSVFSLQPQNSKEKEKMEILVDLLEQWEKTGLPPLPPLAEIGLPKFDPAQFDIEDHWTNFIDKTDLTQRQKDQQEALWELLYTELEYIRALYVIHDLFMCCLLNIQNAGVLNEIELDNMFSNITELASTNSAFWSNELIAVLEYSRKNKCLFNPSLLKPAFTNFGDKFKPYTKYCIEQKRCSDYVKKSHHEQSMFKAFVGWAEAQKQCNRLKLHDLLVKPMQRMTRYGLLLRAIHKNTDEQEVKQDLMEMIKNVDKFVTAVDQTLTNADEKEKLKLTAARIEPYEAIDVPLVDNECAKILSQTYMSLDLLSPMPGCGNQFRYNLMEGALRLRDMNAKIDVHCILFTDMLLFTKQIKRDKLKIIKPPIRIDSLSIHEMKDNPCLLLVHLTDFGVAQAAYTLHGDNITKWAKTFKKAQMMYMKCKEQTKKESAASLTDFELDDIGFSGPLTSKPSDPVFTDYVDNDFDRSTQPVTDSPEVQRTSSFTSLNEAEETDNASDTGAHVSKTVSSPDIGRKHHTLPPNYKHEMKVHRKSSSSSSESPAPSSRRKTTERKRRMGTNDRYLTAEAVMSRSEGDDSSNSANQQQHEDRISFQIGSTKHGQAAVNNEDSDSDFASAELNCDTRQVGTTSNRQQKTTAPRFSVNGSDSSSASLSANNNMNAGGGHSPPIQNYNEPVRLMNGTNKSGSSIKDSAGADSKNRKISQMDLARIKKFQDFLMDSSPGVQI